MDSHLAALRQGPDILDFPALLTRLFGYRAPRHKISAWVKEGVLIRLKNGVYQVNPLISEHPSPLPRISNLLYGPSYVSVEWACSHYGLIPEGPEMVTAVSPNRDKTFNDARPPFSYRYQRLVIYREGFTYDRDAQYLIATPEKVLMDLLYFKNFRKEELADRASFPAYLEEDLRIDITELARLDRPLIDTFAALMKRPQNRMLAGFIRTLR